MGCEGEEEAELQLRGSLTKITYIRLNVGLLRKPAAPASKKKFARRCCVQGLGMHLQVQAQTTLNLPLASKNVYAVCVLCWQGAERCSRPRQAREQVGLTQILKTGMFCPRSWIFSTERELAVVLDRKRKAFCVRNLDLALNLLRRKPGSEDGAVFPSRLCDALEDTDYCPLLVLLEG